MSAEEAQQEVQKTEAEITEQSATLADKAKEEIKEIEAEAEKVVGEIKKGAEDAVKDVEAKIDSVKKDAPATTAAEGKEEPKGWKKYLAKIKSYAKKIST
ncbi:hypothetical protein B5S28_g4403 [[Candida] boidinii]|uniref:Unnamed protein product n=1 Tax=Candida boidinii TaxID=5477 RepID=A0ACB5TMP5_CANBO|nr:hypothetical protein B5S28_g4403 [[Candida] boidinii]OWB75821.1 hypothetical protein B5S31_g5834 [[Candida] boidinii]OWB77477.1 hypothetical protein B5S32_g1643 [[Candida] boidinii]GME91360.1 unnamed protein product [[Candida] boidinii]GMF00020.1 unnamed protein product [[Candida] boidinii]